MTFGIPQVVLPEGYARWQQRLAQSCFEGRAHQPVVLFIDRDELQRLADPGEDAARSLAAAVRQITYVDRGSSMFAHGQELAERWRRGLREQPPPTLPILALSVLAASEMRTDGSARRNAYYRRLVGALLPDATDEAMMGRAETALRNGAAFLAVVAMWEQLDRWLGEQKGAFGTSTIQAGIANESRIGYPLSQTLVRRSDRAALTRFFSAAQLKSEGVPSADSLLQMLRRWVTRRGHGLTDRFVESLRDYEVLPILEPILYELATAWDGKIITAEGLRRLEMHLAVDLDDALTWWVVPAARDIAGDLLKGMCSGEAFEAVITADPHSTMYRAEGLPTVRASALTSGLVARGEHCVAEFQSAKVLVLAGNADAGGWMSVDVVQPFEEHVFIATSDVAGVVSQALQSAADRGWRALDAAFAHRLLGSTGFSVFSRVVFSDQERLDNAVAAMPGAVAAGLRRGAAVRPRLINGLPIDRHLAANVYLAGGEPDLVLPVSDEVRYADVSLDGQSSRLRASLFPIPLSRFEGGMESGDHAIAADDETLNFVVERGSVDDREPDTASVGWVDGVLCGAAIDGAEISGAQVLGMEVERPVLARRGSALTILIDADGRTTKISDPPLPASLPGLTFAFFELPATTAVWLAQKRAAGWSVTKLRGAEPAFRGLTDDDRALWEELSAGVRTPSPLWPLYSRAWERLRAR